MKKLISTILLALTAVSYSSGTLASCQAPKANDCSFYRKCVQKKFNCAHEEYPIGYGEKYCNKFNALTSSDLSAYGILWRDETLSCLQKALVPTLSPSSEIKTCSQLDTVAFDSHPACYTNVYMSICELPAGDWQTIVKVVDPSDYLSTKSAKQIASVIKTCAGDLFATLDELDDAIAMSSARVNTHARYKSALKERELLELRSKVIEKLLFIEDLERRN